MRRPDQPQEPFTRQVSVFLGFEIDLAAREIWREGIAQPVQPKVFDLLTYLIAHRDRVVTKLELLSRFWPGVVVSENVVARTVMKAREAVGDTDESPTVIKTIPRVGYRFVESPALGAGDTAAWLDAHPPQAGRPGLQPVSICVMPVDNRLFNEQYAWVPLGLSSLIAQAFDRDARFATVPVVTMLQTLGTLGASATPEQRARALIDILGAGCVVASVVERSDEAFVLTYRGLGRVGHGLSGRLEGVELTGLGQALAMAIERHVLPAAEHHVRFESGDPLANQAYARASQASNEQKYASALNLLEVVLDIEPRNTAALLLKLQVLMNTLDPRALSIGEQVLQHAKELGNSQLLAQVHASIAYASLGRNGPTPLTVQHAEAAIALCGEGRSDAVSLLIYGQCAVVAQARGDDSRARALALHSLAQHESSGNRHARARTLMILAYCDVRESAYATAGRRLEESLAFFSEHGFRDTALFALSNLAGLVHARVGRWVRALRQSDQALGWIAELGGQPSAILPLANLSGIYAEFSRAADIERGMSLLKELPTEDSPNLFAALLALRAHLAIAQGDFLAAREPLRRVLGLRRSQLAPTRMRLSAVRLLRNEMRTGCFAEALAVAGDLLRDEPGLQADAEIEGLQLHARAALLHADGDRPGARRALAAAIARLPPGDAHARARLDAAWLAIERGALPEARALLGEIPHWVQEHPLGMAVQGRLAWAEGNRPAASAALDDCVAATAAVWPALLALQSFCGDVRTPDGAVPPPLPRLLSTLPDARQAAIASPDGRASRP